LCGRIERVSGYRTLRELRIFNGAGNDLFDAKISVLSEQLLTISSKRRDIFSGEHKILI
jgi:hypothetical protein